MPEPVQPILGPLARQAVKLPIEGQKRRKLLILLAAYADAGVPNPSARELMAHMPFLKPEAWRAFDGLLEALEDAGWIEVERDERKITRRYRRTNVYTLHLESERVAA